MPGQLRGSKPGKFRTAPLAAQHIFWFPYPLHSKGCICSHPANFIAVGPVHPCRIAFPLLSVVPAARAGVKKLVGQHLPAAFLRAPGHRLRHLDIKSPLLKFTASKPGDRSSVDPHLGFNFRRKRDPQTPGLLHHHTQQPVAIIQRSFPPPPFPFVTTFVTHSFSRVFSRHCFSFLSHYTQIHLKRNPAHSAPFTPDLHPNRPSFLRSPLILNSQIQFFS